MKRLKFTRYDSSDIPEGFFFGGGCVYIAHIGGICKVGCSTNPLQRIDRIQSASGIIFQDVYVSQNVLGHYCLERKIHGIIYDYKLCGEWFKIDPKLIISMSKDVDVDPEKGEMHSIYKKPKKAREAQS